MKKILAIALLFALCLGVLAMTGCDKTQHESTDELPTQPGENNNTQTQKPLEYDVVAYDGSEVTITFSHTMNATYRGVLDQYIAKFNEMYPNITVEHAQIGGYDEVRDQIKTELTAGNQPNIAYCYPDHVALYNVA